MDYQISWSDTVKASSPHEAFIKAQTDAFNGKGDLSVNGKRLHGSLLITSNLTNQQRYVMELISQGMNNKEIAKFLNVKINTVKSHITKLLRHTGAINRVQIAARITRFHALQGDYGVPS